jgi:hypothetical protein
MAPKRNIEHGQWTADSGGCWFGFVLVLALALALCLVFLLAIELEVGAVARRHMAFEKKRAKTKEAENKKARAPQSKFNCNNKGE